MSAAMAKPPAAANVAAEVRSLFRSVLRRAKLLDAASADPAAQASTAHARSRFRTDAASVRRIEFQRIEYLVRKGKKQLDVMAMSGARGVGGGSR